MTDRTVKTPTADARMVTLEILIEVLEKGQFSHIVIRQALDGCRSLSDKDRAFVSRLSRGCIERCIELDAMIDSVASVKAAKQKPVIRNILRMAAFQLKYMDVPAHAACSEAVKLAAKKGFAPLKGFVNAVVRRMADAVEEPGAFDFSKSPWIYYSVPGWLYDTMLGWYTKEKVHAYLLAVQDSKGHAVYVHCHSREHGTDEVRAVLEAEGVSVKTAPYARDCLELSGSGDISHTEPFKKGWIQIQDISSALAAQCVAPEPGSFCMDVCSAPGGKGIYLAMQPGVKVLCRDISQEKLSLIEENKKRCHATNMQLQLWDASVEDEKDNESADYVLADVPCSGLGILRRKPDIKYRITQEGLNELCMLQRKILSCASKLVKPGGVLVYSTCTINPGENEENIRWFLENAPFRLESLVPFLDEDIEGCNPESGMMQLLPGQNRCDGFFIARLRKAEKDIQKGEA